MGRFVAGLPREPRKPSLVRRSGRFVKRRVRRAILWALRPIVGRFVEGDDPGVLAVRALRLEVSENRHRANRREMEIVSLGQRLADAEDARASERLDRIERALRDRGILE